MNDPCHGFGQPKYHSWDSLKNCLIPFDWKAGGECGKIMSEFERIDILKQIEEHLIFIPSKTGLSRKEIA